MVRLKFINEFKAFALKGSIIDLAVGVVIGSAFGKIVSSLVSDVIMPPIGWLVGGVNFSELKLTLPQNILDSGKVATINYGLFLQSVFDFLIIAIAVFVALKFLIKLRIKEEKKTTTPKPTQEELLTEIRDLLKEQNQTNNK